MIRRSQSLNENPIFRALAIVTLIALVGLLIWFFEQWPIEGTTLALDWRSIHSGLRGGVITYGPNIGMRAPPWNAVMLLPMGLLSMRASWGLIAFITLFVLVLAVPRGIRGRTQLLIAVLLVASYPSLRHLADGNLEGFIISAGLLCIAGFNERRVWVLGLGILLLPIKIQEAWLIVPVLGLYILGSWRPELWTRLALGVLAVIIVPSVLLLPQWINGALGIGERGSIMDASFTATTARLSIPTPIAVAIYSIVLSGTLYVAFRHFYRYQYKLHSPVTFTREHAAMCISAGLFLAPYAAGNSYLTIVALGVPALWVRPDQHGWGWLIYILATLPAFMPIDFAYNYSASYTTMILFIAWVVFAAQVWRMSGRAYFVRSALQ